MLFSFISLKVKNDKMLFDTDVGDRLAAFKKLKTLRKYVDPETETKKHTPFYVPN